MFIKMATFKMCKSIKQKRISVLSLFKKNYTHSEELCNDPTTVSVDKANGELVPYWLTAV